jgi:phospholipid N-methyltransferase
LTLKLTHSIRFFKRYLNDPRSVGAIAPSSAGLAQALCDPYRRCERPARVLEIGAGTGSVTRVLGRVLSPLDYVDICEVNPVFVDILEKDVLTDPDFRDAVSAGRVRLLRMPVQEIADVEPYDFIVSGLPFTAFELKDVEDIFEVIRRCLKPRGVFSYFEYVGLRRTSAALSWGKSRSRVRSVSSFMTRTIKKHEFARRTVFRNLPPAHARHLRFTDNSSAFRPA